MSLIKLTNIQKVFQISEDVTFQALKDINLTVEKGEWLAIVGASGSGKSTLLYILGLLDKPTGGIYELDGEDVSNFPENRLARIRNKKIGFIFQSFNLLARTTVLNNVALPLIYAGISQKDRLDKARKAIDQVGLSAKLNTYTNQLSGGQQQRVAIARALVTEPDVILADEPTGNLDSKTGAEIIELLRQLHNQGRTIIMITHDRDIAINAPRTVEIKDGEIVHSA